MQIPCSLIQLSSQGHLTSIAGNDLTGNTLCLQGTSSGCCVIHSCSEKGSETMPNSNCEFISKATNLSRAMEEGGVQSHLLLEFIRTGWGLKCGTSSLHALYFLFYGVKCFSIYLWFAWVKQEHQEGVRRSRRCLVFAWDLQACKGMGWCKVSCHLTLSPQRWKCFWTPPE